MKIVMPQMGMTMTEGAISKWYKNDGDRVEKGELLFCMISEKLVNDIEALVSGTLKIIRQADEEAFMPCGEEIGEIIED